MAFYLKIINLWKLLFLKHLKPYLFILLLLISFTVFGQNPPPDPPDGGGGPGTVNDAPINFIVYPLLVLGSYLGYRFFLNKDGLICK